MKCAGIRLMLVRAAAKAWATDLAPADGPGAGPQVLVGDPISEQLARLIADEALPVGAAVA